MEVKNRKKPPFFSTVVTLFYKKQMSGQVVKDNNSEEYEYGIEEYKKSLLLNKEEEVLTSKIRVHLQRGHNLQKENMVMSSDAMCELFIGNFRKDRKYSSAIKSCNPVWNESFDFEVVDVSKSILVIQVWDKDLFTSDDEIGIAAVHLGKLNLTMNEPFEVILPLNNVKTGKVQFTVTALNFTQQNQANSADYIVDMTVNKQTIRSFQSIWKRRITSEDDKRFDKMFNYMYAEDYIPIARTGDIFLHSGTTFASRAIQIATRSIWSHVGIIIVNPSQRVKELYQLTNSTSNVFVLDSDFTTFDKRFGGGVQMTEVTQFFYKYFNDWDEHNLTVIRRLIPTTIVNSGTSTLEVREDIEDWLVSIHNRPYQQRFLEMILSISRNNESNTNNSFFCSELVAQAYDELKLLNNSGSQSSMATAATSLIYSNFIPHDFSSQSNYMSTLLYNHNLDKPIRMRSKQFDIQNNIHNTAESADGGSCCCSCQ